VTRTPGERSARVRAAARHLGFLQCGITTLDPPPHAAALDRWLAAGMAGTMGYLPRQARNRKDPARIIEGTNRAVVVTRNYYRPDPPTPRSKDRGRVAKYARATDYHRALAEPLNRLATTVRECGPPGAVARWFLDAGPVPERELAQRAGLGWIGKNTMLIGPRHGSFTFIGVILTDVDLEIDAPFEADRCGSCTRCLDACPTDAFPEPRVLDARRCISYLTIEYRGAFDDPPPGLDGWVFGCDVCQDVCPWNHRFARPEADPTLGGDPGLAELDLDELVSLDDESFARRYAHTALERTGASGLRRNARALRRGPAAPGAPELKTGGVIEKG